MVNPTIIMSEHVPVLHLDLCDSRISKAEQEYYDTVNPRRGRRELDTDVLEQR